MRYLRPSANTYLAHAAAAHDFDEYVTRVKRDPFASPLVAAVAEGAAEGLHDVAGLALSDYLTARRMAGARKARGLRA